MFVAVGRDGLIATSVDGSTSCSPWPGAGLPFSDVAGHWAANQGYLQTAYQMGFIGGFPDGTFRPDAPLWEGTVYREGALVTRAEVAMLLANLQGR